MKFSEQWLREWVDPRLPTRALAELLTMSGFEVESVEAHRSESIGAKAEPDEPSPGARDNIFEIALTPNRGDCLSIRGLAREIALLTGARLRRPTPKSIRASIRAARKVTLTAPKACPRYAGRVIDGIDATRPTPHYIAERLRRSGLRPVSVVVDITNYVMLESGQPLHAFDNARLDGGITVRMGREGEALTLLDGKRCELATDMLVIADAAGPVALAGIMGGADSAVSDRTRTVFLESAWFAPAAIAGRARRLGMQTDASFRFERGCDAAIQVEAIEQATALVLKHCGGQAGPVMDVKHGALLPKARSIRLRRQRLDELLGLELEPRRALAILKRLASKAQAEAAGWRVVVPHYRHDLALEVDLIEEIARIHGYRQIPAKRLTGPVAMHRGHAALTRSWRQLLAARGYFEAITYSFVDADIQGRLCGGGETVRLKNPIASDQGVMRLSLWPGLLLALRSNQARQQGRVRLFEYGRVYRPGAAGRPLESPRIAGMVAGSPFPRQWDFKERAGDFFDLKGDVEALLDRARAGMTGVDWLPAEHPALQPGQAASIHIENQRVGLMGALHPAILQELGIDGPVLAFELDPGALPTVAPIAFQPPSRYPAMRRDVALEVARSLPAGELVRAVRAAAGPLLANLELFDVYQGEGIDLGKKSVALCLTFQKTSSTLIEEEIEDEKHKILNFLREKFGASLRS